MILLRYVIAFLCVSYVSLDGQLLLAITIEGVAVTASSEEAGRPAVNTVNDVGFDRSTLTVTSTTIEGTWNTNGFTITDCTRENTWIMFDLRALQYVATMKIYNYNRPTHRERRFVTADIWYAPGPVTTYNPTPSAPGGWIRIRDDMPLKEAPYTTNYNTPTEIPLQIQARYIVINDIVNAGVGGDGGNNYGLNKVIFETAEDSQSKKP